MKVNFLDACWDNIAKICDKRIKINKEKSNSNAELVIKELRENRNWSWYDELYFRNKNNLDKVALFYRGYEITYGEMFEKMKSYAKSLKANGIEKGMEIPVCMSNTPEFVYLLGAVSLVGAKVNIFSDDFDKDYLKEIIDGCDSDIIFIEDNAYEKIGDVVNSSHVKKVILSSLSDSFVDGIDYYADLDKSYKSLFDKKDFDNSSGKLYSINDFVKDGENYSGSYHEKMDLDDPFTITYSSGTTSKTPKPIVHAIRSFNFITRFHDKEVNHNTPLNKFQMMVFIPTFSSTGLISGISDSLTQGCRLAIEPLYFEDFVTNALVINKPSYLDLTKSHWLRFAKDVLYDPKYKDVKLPSLFICFSVGEGTEFNEEKLINRALKKVNAGRDIIPVVPFTKLSIAGGDCEHGGIYYTLFRAYQNKKPFHLLKKEEAGVEPFGLIDYDIIDENGNHCIPYQVGRFVATSQLNMIGYKNNPEATEKLIVKDANGKEYLDCYVDAYQDFYGKVHIKGRRTGECPTFEIADCVLSDRKNVLSCVAVSIDDKVVIHVEFVPDVSNTYDQIVKIEERLKEKFGDEFTKNIVYRVHSLQDPFMLTHSGKRDMLSLINEGVSSHCIKPVLVDGEYYFNNKFDFLEEDGKVYQKDKK